MESSSTKFSSVVSKGCESKEFFREARWVFVNCKTGSFRAAELYCPQRGWRASGGGLISKYADFRISFITCDNWEWYFLDKSAGSVKYI